ncbi:single insulin-like growth factor-binding domain protein-2 [Agrilus planipennis]|uniref:Single insulin-like growth factor-binding domain protein-2 n=1 Tax=Agrilus planipennis TaxID=224129 RepID=A0A1W4WWD6_AGRPL|nr:single insulin-like growth factor-binding domain protein-2 [Agrilus planipennis]
MLFRKEITMKILLVFALCVPVFCSSASVPACVCDRRDCEEVGASECPGLGILVWDPCGCCLECARTEGEPCGGELGFSGTCEPGLSCQQPGPSPSEGVCRLLPSDDNERLNNNFL